MGRAFGPCHSERWARQKHRAEQVFGAPRPRKESSSKRLSKPQDFF